MLLSNLGCDRMGLIKRRGQMRASAGIWSVKRVDALGQGAGAARAKVAAKSDRFCAIWLILPAR